MRLPLVLTTTLILGLACTCASGPSFKITGSSADRSCTSTRSCVRVRCTVQNVGAKDALAEVTVELYRLDGTSLSATEQRVLATGATEEVAHDFELAEPPDGEPRYSCHAGPVPAG